MKGTTTAFLLILTLAGCGSQSLVGTWKTYYVNGTRTGNATYAFDSNGTVTFVGEEVDSTTRCTASASFNRGTWSTNGSSLTIDPGTVTTSTTGCTNPANNVAANSGTGASTTSAYAIDGTALTISNATGSSTYTKQ